MIIGAGLDARLGLPFDQLRTAAREAERLGVQSLWEAAGGAAGFREPLDAGGRRARLVPRLRGLVEGHRAAHRDLRGPGGADVDAARPRGPGGHAGAALRGTVRARPW